VEKGDRGVSANQDAAPDQRTDRTEAHAELIDLGQSDNGHAIPGNTRATGRGAEPNGREERVSTTRGLYRKRVDG
jgi:hypothetical protein